MICKECGHSFMQLPSQVKHLDRVFCSKPCWYSWRTKNFVPWNKGLKGVMKANSGSFKKGEHPSPATEFKIGDKVGSRNNLWKGGITSLRMQIQGHYKYRQWRSDIFTRDNYTCQNCNIRGCKLHAHHIEKFSSIMEKNNIKTLEQAIDCDELWNINNGQTLCLGCHKLTEDYLVPDFVIDVNRSKNANRKT